MLSTAPVMAVVATTDLQRAQGFYEQTLGLKAATAPMPEEAGTATYECGGGSTLLVYERATAGDSEATCANFTVDDVDAAVEQLRGNGVRFEDYDMEGLRTENGIATMGDFKAAWFKDPDGNILCVSS